MRVTIALPLVAVFALSGCGSSGIIQQAKAQGGVSQSEMAAQAANMETPRPGKYKTHVEVSEVSVPGLSPSMEEQMKSMMSKRMDVTYCQTGHSAEDAVKEMTRNMRQGDCTNDSFNVQGNHFTLEMTCTTQGGKGHFVIDGTTSTEGSDMTMEMTQAMPGSDGQMHMKSHVVSTRIGECDS